MWFMVFVEECHQIDLNETKQSKVLSRELSVRKCHIVIANNPSKWILYQISSNITFSHIPTKNQFQFQSLVQFHFQHYLTLSYASFDISLLQLKFQNRTRSKLCRTKPKTDENFCWDCEDQNKVCNRNHVMTSITLPLS